MHELTLYQFNVLKDKHKVALLGEQDVFLSSIEARKNNLYLFRLYSFYVEISYVDKLNTSFIIRSFLSEDPLKPYLEKIDLAELGF